MTAAPLLLVPPSEGKRPDGDGPPAVPPAVHHDPAVAGVHRTIRRAVEALVAGSGRVAAERLLGVRGVHLERAVATWREVDDAPTLPAWQRYDGVVWRGLDPATLDRAGRSRLRRRVVVPSALWGPVRADDPLPPYRLAMGATIPGLGRPSALWWPVLGPWLARAAAGGAIFDLLPTAHARAVDPAAIPAGRLVRVSLVTGDGRTAIGHAGKRIKGRLVRAMLEADTRSARALAGLEVAGLTHLETVREADGHRRVTLLADPA